MKIRRLLAHHRRREFRQDVFQQSAVAQQDQTVRGGRRNGWLDGWIIGWLDGWMVGWLGRARDAWRVFATNPFIHQSIHPPRLRRREQFYQLIPHALGADEFYFRRERLNRRKRFWLDRKTQPRGETHGAQQPQMIFAKTFLRHADGADDFCAQIFFAADPVVDFFCERIVEQSVHREIAAQRIGLGVGENNFLRAAAILVIRLGAKRGHLKLLPALDHDDDAEFSADGNGFAEQFFHLLRLGVRGDVEILRLAAEQKIAHAAAHPERGEARALQATNNFSGDFTRRIHGKNLTQKRKGTKTQRNFLRALAVLFRNLVASCEDSSGARTALSAGCLGVAWNSRTRLSALLWLRRQPCHGFELKFTTRTKKRAVHPRKKCEANDNLRLSAGCGFGETLAEWK